MTTRVLLGKMEFHKSLAKYYKTWLANAEESIHYCEKKGEPELAKQYAESAEAYRELIAKHEEAIEFFSVGDRAFLKDEALPEKFRGYK